MADFTEHASNIVSAYVAHNSVPAAELPNLLRSVHDALAALGKPAPVDAPAEPLKPAVSIRKSVTDDYLISLEDGRKFKALKRYLAGLGMTPADYRAKWGLPSDYPMVAPAYAARRSELARTTGLGLKVVQSMPAPAAEDAPQPEPETAALRLRRSGGGRRRRRDVVDPPSTMPSMVHRSAARSAAAVESGKPGCVLASPGRLTHSGRAQLNRSSTAPPRQLRDGSSPPVLRRVVQEAAPLAERGGVGGCVVMVKPHTAMANEPSVDHRRF